MNSAFRYFLLLLFIHGTSCLGLGQVEIQNLEILDHSNNRTISSSVIYHNGDILYVIHDDRNEFNSTKVRLKKDDITPIDLLDNLMFHATSSVAYDSQGKLRILLHGKLPTYTYSRGFVEIKEEGDSYIVSDYSPYYNNSSEIVNSLALDSLDNLYALSDDGSLKIFDQYDLVEDTLIAEINKSKIHANADGKIFVINENQFTVSHLNNLELEYVGIAPGKIKEIKNIADDIWLIDENNTIYIFDKEFTNGLEIFNPLNTSSLNQVSVVDSSVYVLEPKQNGFDVYEYAGGQFAFISEFEEDIASSESLQMLNHSSFITSGQFEIPGISNQAFIRGYNMSEDFIPKRKNLRLENFNMTFSGDSIVAGSQLEFSNYDIDYTLSNADEEPVYYTSTYSSLFALIAPNFNYPFDHQLYQTIEGNQIITIDTTKLLVASQVGTGMVAVTGADYQFNSLYQPISINYQTSNISVVTKPPIEVLPNPFINKIKLNNLDKDKMISLYDMNGSMILQSTVYELENLNLEFLHAGVYFLSIDESKTIKKLVKQ